MDEHQDWLAVRHGRSCPDVHIQTILVLLVTGREIPHDLLGLWGKSRVVRRLCAIRRAVPMHQLDSEPSDRGSILYIQALDLVSVSHIAANVS